MSYYNKTMGFKLNNTKWIAHRGYSSQEVENTLPAFLLACKEKGFDGIECDIQTTKDQKFVVFHDRDLKRMCGVEKLVKDLTLSELQEYPMYNKNGVLDYNYHIPSLEEYIEICKKYKKTCFVEIKSYMRKKQLSLVLDTIEKLNYLDNCVFISFHITCLMIMRLLKRNIKLQYICDYKLKKLNFLCKRFRIGIDYKYSIIKNNEIQSFKKLGLLTNSWTVNDKNTAKNLIAYDIDYITSNYLF